MARLAVQDTREDAAQQQRDVLTGGVVDAADVHIQAADCLILGAAVVMRQCRLLLALQCRFQGGIQSEVDTRETS